MTKKEMQTHETEIFCDPRCGKGCTRAEHDRIVSIVGEVKAMCGDGWGHRIWDNLGWHYEVTSPCGRLRIQDASPYPYGDFEKGFECVISPPGEVHIDWAGFGETPHDAAKDALKNMMSAIGYLFEGASVSEMLPAPPRLTIAA
jgi:hypothetical protein